MLHYFSGTYESARERFNETAQCILSQHYPKLTHDSLEQQASLYSDWWHGQSGNNSTLLILTSGLHGIEGYAGSAMQLQFLSDHMKQVNTGEVDILLIHGINAYGMKHHRKETQHNLNLNRNAIHDFSKADLRNPGFDELQSLFIKRSGSGRCLDYIPFTLHVLYDLLRLGPHAFLKAATLGQFKHPTGFYYGGHTQDAYFSDVLSRLVDTISAYQHVVMLDCHTGYGPAGQVQLVMSSEDPRHAREVEVYTRYPIVDQPRDQQFYAIEGEWLNYLYEETKNRHIGFLGLTLECGTLGKHPFALLRTLKATIDENRLFFNQAVAPRRIRERFDALYIPKNKQWRRSILNETSFIFNNITEWINDPKSHSLIKRSLQPIEK